MGGSCRIQSKFDRGLLFQISKGIIQCISACTLVDKISIFRALLTLLSCANFSVFAVLYPAE